MIGGIRLFAIGFVVLTVIYAYLSIRQLWRCRRALEATFDAGGIEGSREDYVAQGLLDYERSLRRKLILGVYILPLMVVLVTIYVVNYM